MEQEVERPSVEEELGEAARSEPSADPSLDGLSQSAAQALPIVREELSLLQVVLKKLDGAQRRSRIAVDDAGALIELRDALAEAKPEDQGSLLEQMHRIEALSRQRGKGDSPPVDRKSPYFGHMRLEEAGRRRDVLVGQRGYVEPGGGVQIVDWRNAPVSRLFYRYEEGDYYEEQLGDRMVEGEVIARRTVTIVNAELRRVNSAQGTYARDLASGQWREVNVRQAKLSVARDGSVTVHSEPPAGVLPAMPAAQAKAARQAGLGQRRLGMDAGATRVDRFLPAIAALIDPRQFELITRPTSGLIVVQGSAGSGKTTIGLHRIAYLAFADPKRFKPERMLVVVYQRALATYVSRVLPSLDVPGVPVMTFGAWAEELRKSTFASLGMDTTDATPSVVVRAKSHGAMLKILDDRQAAIADWCRVQLAEAVAGLAGDPGTATASGAVLQKWDSTSGPVDLRVTSLAKWVKEAPLSPQTRATIEGVGSRLRSRTRDVIGEWAALLTDRQALGAGFDKHAPGVFTPGQLDEMVRWCSERERKRTAGRADQDDSDPYALDVEDDALLLRVHQVQRGALGGNPAR